MPKVPNGTMTKHVTIPVKESGQIVQTLELYDIGGKN